MKSSLITSPRRPARARSLLCAGTAFPLLVAAWPALAQPIVQQANGEVVVDAENADGTPVAVNLSSSGGTISATVDSVSGAYNGQTFESIVALQTGSGAITADFGSINGSGTGFLRAVDAQSQDGDISISVGTVSIDGAATAGVHAHSVTGDVELHGNDVLLLGTATDPDYVIYPEGMLAISDEGSATIIAGRAETYGEYGSAVAAVAGTDARVEIDTAIAHSEGAVSAYAEGGTSTTIVVDTASMLGEGGTAVQATGGGTIDVTAGTVESAGGGIFARGVGDISVEAGTVTAALNGIRAESMQGGIVNVDVTGSVSTSGATRNAILAITSGAINISAADVAVTGPGGQPSVGSDGIALDQGGIIVSGGAGAIGIDAGTVDVAGEYRQGISVRTSGAISITADDVRLESSNANAIGIYGDAGDVTVNTDTVTATGASGRGIFVNTNSGNIGINANVTRADNEGYVEYCYGGTGIYAVSESGSITVDSAEAYSNGLYGSAIEVYGGGDVVVHSGKVEVSGQASSGIIAESAEGDVWVTADETIHSSEGQGYALAVEALGGNATLEIGTLAVTGGGGGARIRSETALGKLITTGNVTVAHGTAIEGSGVDVSIITGDQTLTSGDSAILIRQASSGSVSNNGTALSAGYGSAAIDTTTTGSITIASNIAQATGDGGSAIRAMSLTDNVSIDSISAVATGAAIAAAPNVPAYNSAVVGLASNGIANVRVTDVTASGTGMRGVLALGREANVVVDGTVTAAAAGVVTNTANSTVLINGSVTGGTAGVVANSPNSLVEVSATGDVSGANGVILWGTPQGGGFSELQNNGTITGTTGEAVLGVNTNVQVPEAQIYIRNNGTLSGAGGVAVRTGAMDDVLELTEASMIDGIVDLGDGDDRLTLDFNDGVTGAVGQVASTINVEGLSVDSGSWRAQGIFSEYDFVEVEDGATLTVAENADGELAIATPYVELDGRLNLEYVTDTVLDEEASVLFEGAGELHLTGSATVTVEDATGLQHTGGTFVDNGELLLTTIYGGDITTSGDGVFELGMGGDFTGNLVNDGKFLFSRTDDYDFLGDFSGSGVLEKQGDGKLTFAGLYAFTGTTSILGGEVAFEGGLAEDTELEITDGAVDLSQVEGGQQQIAQLSGTGGSVALGSTQLTINQGANTVYSGALSGSGTLVKTGSGDLKLNGDGTGYTGTAQVGGGTLSVNGNFANAGFVVSEGGRLGGAGTVGTTSVQGGTLAPGNSIDTLTVNGDVTFTAASVFEVEANAAGEADRIEATGQAALGGASVSVLAENGNYEPLTSYTILTADGGISGTFSSVTSNLAFLDPSLSYEANAVMLTLARNDTDFASLGTTPNQQAIGALIESYGYGNALYDETLELADTAVAASFESLTGAVYPAYSTAIIETAEILRRQASSAMAGGEGPFAWATGLYNDVSGGSAVSLEGKGGAGGFGYGAGGISLSVGLGQIGQDSDNAQIADSDVTFVIGQLNYDMGTGFVAKAAVQAGWVEADIARTPTLGAFTQNAGGRVKGDYQQFSGEIGYVMPLGTSLRVGPFAGISHVTLDFDPVVETGGATALTVTSDKRKVTFGDIGIRLTSGSGEGIKPYGSAAYRRAWGDRASTASVGFAGNPGTADVSALPLAKDAAELEAGIAYSAGLFDLDLGYTGSLSKGIDSHGVKLGARIRF